MSLAGYGGPSNQGQKVKKTAKKDAMDEKLDELFHYKEGTCCLCGKHFDNYGHNAYPVAEGRCCDDCQQTQVLPARQRESLEAKVDEANKFIKVSKEYLRLCANTWNKLQKRMPKLWQAITTRRYVLPQYRQPDYYSQETCDYLMLDFLMKFTQGSSAGDDEVLNTQYVSLVRALEFNRPTLFLEKDFAPVLMKSPLPEDYELGDIQWRYPSFRIYLPKGFLTIKRDGEVCSMMYLDIVRIHKGDSYILPLAIKAEIIKEWGGFYIPPFENKYDGMGVSGNLDFDCKESAIGYAATTPIDAVNIGKVLSIVSGHELKTPLKSDDLDHEFTNRMIAIALKVLLFLSSYEIIPDPVGADVIREPKMKGDRQLVGLYKAKFVGESAIRLTESGAKAKGISIDPSGRSTIPHWVSGHWQRICHGPKHSLRKLVWIGIYHTGKK